MAAKKAKKPTTKVVVEKAMPGWTVVHVPKPAGTPDAKAKAPKADAVSPSLRNLKVKVMGKKTVKVEKIDALKKHKGAFVVVRPKNAPDAATDQRKVVVVRDGKVVAKQG